MPDPLVIFFAMFAMYALSVVLATAEFSAVASHRRINQPIFDTVCITQH
jgi:hypothetical protein